MPQLNEVKLQERIAAGQVTAHALLNALATERNSLEIVTMPTLGAFDSALMANEQSARQKLDAAQVDAAHNVPILERALTALGESTETYVCKSCGKHRPSRHCSMCYEPQEY
jgi:rubrerythrin